MQNRRKDLIDILKEKSPLTGQLTDYEMLEIIRLMPLHAYRENATILTKGEPANSLMFLISGEVNVHLNEHRVAKLTQGDVIGEAMFSDQGIRIADAVAAGPTEVLLFDHSTYEYLLREDTKVALKCKLIFEHLYKKIQWLMNIFLPKILRDTLP